MSCDQNIYTVNITNHILSLYYKLPQLQVHEYMNIAAAERLQHASNTLCCPLLLTSHNSWHNLSSESSKNISAIFCAHNGRKHNRFQQLWVTLYTTRLKYLDASFANNFSYSSIITILQQKFSSLLCNAQNYGQFEVQPTNRCNTTSYKNHSEMQKQHQKHYRTSRIMSSGMCGVPTYQPTNKTIWCFISPHHKMK